MTHEEAIDTLLELVAGNGAVPAERREEAETHASACAECLDMAYLIYEATAGTSNPERTRRRFGCDDVQEGLYQLVGLTPQEARERHPGLVGHLTWCTSCRVDLAMLARMDDAAAHQPSQPSPASPWTEVTERVYELGTQLSIAIGARMARWHDLSDALLQGLTLGPVPAIQTRAIDEVDASVIAPNQRLSIMLGTSGLTARMDVEPEGTERARLTLVLEGSAQRAVTITLRRTDASPATIVAAQSTTSARAFVVRELPPGAYVIEIAELEPPRRFRIRLQANPSTRGSDII